MGSGVDGLSDVGEVGPAEAGAERTAVAAMVQRSDVPIHDLRVVRLGAGKKHRIQEEEERGARNGVLGGKRVGGDEGAAAFPRTSGRRDFSPGLLCLRDLCRDPCDGAPPPPRNGRVV